MNLEINLLRKTQTISHDFLKLLNFLRLIAVVSLIIFILSSLIVFYLNSFRLNQEARQIAERIELASKAIQAEKTTEGIYLSYLQKLSAIEKLTGGRFDPAQILRKIKIIIPLNTTISEIRLDRESISFEVEFSSLENFEETVSRLKQQKELKIREFTLSGFEKDQKTGRYRGKFQIALLN